MERDTELISEHAVTTWSYITSHKPHICQLQCHCTTAV